MVRASVRWRHDNKIGLAFSEAQPGIIGKSSPRNIDGVPVLGLTPDRISKRAIVSAVVFASPVTEHNFGQTGEKSLLRLQCSTSRSLSAISAGALAVFIPWRGADRFDRRSGWHLRGWWVGLAGGAGFFLYAVIKTGGAVELPGRSRAGTWRRRLFGPGIRSMSSSLSGFSWLALAVFIPWRGADGSDRRSGWRPR